MIQPIDHVDPYRAYLYGPPTTGEEIEWNRDQIEVGDASACAAALDELKRLFGAYGVEFLLGARHSCPSPTWRDESVSDVRHHSLSRFATRVHVFEKAASRPNERTAGRYLGFVCLRPPGPPDVLKERKYGFRYLIEAELVRPRHMQRPRYHLIQTTASTPRLGVLPFPSTVFMTPRPGVEASTCVHLAISQALHLVMGRFGAKPISQREFEACLWDELWRQTVKGKGPSIKRVARRGVSLPTALKIVKEHCSAGGFIADISRNSNCLNDRDLWREAHRCLTDTLANGLPIIMMVDHYHLIPGKRRKPVPHAALIFGMRLLHSGHELGPARRAPGQPIREDEAELPGIFIGHDSLLGPYVEWGTGHLLRAAIECPPLPGDDPRPRAETRGVRFLALGPPRMNIGLHEVRYLAQRAVRLHSQVAPDFYGHYYDEFADTSIVPVPDRTAPGKWRFVTRLLTMPEVLDRYLKNASEPDLSALAQAFDPEARQYHPAKEALGQWGFCWAVELLLPAYKQPRLAPEGPDSLVRPTHKALVVLLWSIADSFERDFGSPSTVRTSRAFLALDRTFKAYRLKRPLLD
jgi:hypothetical protein